MDEVEDAEDDLDEVEGEEEDVGEKEAEDLPGWIAELAVELDTRGYSDEAEIVRGLLARL